MVVSEQTKKILFSKEAQDLREKYKNKFGESPPPFNYSQYTCGEEMLKKMTEAIKTGKPIIPKKELSMFDI